MQAGMLPHRRIPSRRQIPFARLRRHRYNAVIAPQPQKGIIVIAKRIFEEISAKLGDTIESSPVKDVEKNVKAMLGSAFNKMDLVTREEFDIQQQILIKTREKLMALEARIAQLEAAAQADQPTPAAEETAAE